MLKKMLLEPSNNTPVESPAQVQDTRQLPTERSAAELSLLGLIQGQPQLPQPVATPSQQPVPVMPMAPGLPMPAAMPPMIPSMPILPIGVFAPKPTPPPPPTTQTPTSTPVDSQKASKTRVKPAFSDVPSNVLRASLVSSRDSSRSSLATNNTNANASTADIQVGGPGSGVEQPLMLPEFLDRFVDCVRTDEAYQRRLYDTYLAQLAFFSSMAANTNAQNGK